MTKIDASLKLCKDNKMILSSEIKELFFGHKKYIGIMDNVVSY